VRGCETYDASQENPTMSKTVSTWGAALVAGVLACALAVPAAAYDVYPPAGATF